MRTCKLAYTRVPALFNGRTWVFGESRALIRTCTRTRNVLGKPSCKRECRLHGHYARVTGAYMRGGVDIARGLRRSGNYALTKWGNPYIRPIQPRVSRDRACLCACGGPTFSFLGPFAFFWADMNLCIRGHVVRAPYTLGPLAFFWADTWVIHVRPRERVRGCVGAWVRGRGAAYMRSSRMRTCGAHACVRLGPLSF